MGLDPLGLTYADTVVALLTMHRKEQVIVPALRRVGAEVRLAVGIDTDELGTFTRDVPRDGTQRQAARRKARRGMDALSLPHGVASEGAFGPDPYGVMPWNREIVLFVDDEAGIEVVGRAQGPARHADRVVRSFAGVEAFAREAEVPPHAFVLRPEDEGGQPMVKGLSSLAELRAAFHDLAARSASGRVHVEHDLRAHVHPSRMARIGEAADDLAQRLSTRCAVCHAPGFGPESYVQGLPCAACGVPTRMPKAVRWACVRCDHDEDRPVSDPAVADPMHCPLCNP